MGGESPPFSVEQLPDKMTGQDLIRQEEHELQVERNYVDGLDRVDRRNWRDEIISSVPSHAYKAGYDKIDWSIRA